MKERLDILLVERRLVESRVKAQWLIKKGYVIVNERSIIKPGKRIENNSSIRLTRKFPYVGRGGLKLEAALNKFSIVVRGKICADIGASVGGFTDCLLQNGAAKVYAVDTAIDLLHPSLKCKTDKVKILAGIDARTFKNLGESVDIVVIDITFASLKEVLPNIKYYLKEDGNVIVLVKPLFEKSFKKAEKLQIITEKHELIKILNGLSNWALTNGFVPKNVVRSPLLGKGGSIEFFFHLVINNNDVIQETKRNIEKTIISLFQDN